MSTYLRAYPGFSFEIVIVGGKFKKRRIHLLINPNHCVELDVFSPQSPAVNPEGVTHLLYFQKIRDDESTFQKTLRLAELLNKPVIVDEISGKRLRGQGVSVKQLRYISDDDVIPGLKIVPVIFDWNEYDSEVEFVKINDENDKPILVKSIENIKSGIFSIFHLFNFGKEEEVEEEVVKLNRTMAFLMKYNKTSILLPLDQLAYKYLYEIVQNFSPQTVILSDSTLADASKLELDIKNIVVIDNNHPKDKELLIPKSQNTTDFDIKIASSEEWIEL